MNKLTLVTLLMGLFCTTYAQIDSDQLALEVSKAEDANLELLMDYIWKRNTTVSINGEVKATMLSELSFDENGELQFEVIDGGGTAKKKHGIRGRIQKSAMESNLDYVQNAMALSLAYTYMSKGQLIDFFDSGTIKDHGDQIEVTGSDVLVKGDVLTVFIDANTKLFVTKKFSSLMDDDPVAGEIHFDTFSTGVSHGSSSSVTLDSKGALIKSENTDYSKRVE